MPFACDNCNREFSTQQNLNYHTNHNACKTANYECKYCNKQFTAYSNMHRHVKSTCKEKKKSDKNKEDILQKLIKDREKDHEEFLKLKEQVKKQSKQLKEKDKQLKEKDKQLKEKDKQLKKIIKIDKSDNSIKTIKTNNINNGTINNNVNVILVGYGKEDMSKINKDKMLKILQQGFDSTLHLTDHVHFNPDLPEYNNIYISNMKDKFAMMFNGKDWVLTMKDDLVQKVYDDKKNYIETNLDDFVNSLTKDRKNALDRWLATDDDHPRIKKIKDDITLMLYNKRKIAIDKTIKITNKIKINDSDIQSNNSDTESIKSIKKQIKKPIKNQLK